MLGKIKRREFLKLIGLNLAAISLTGLPEDAGATAAESGQNIESIIHDPNIVDTSRGTGHRGPTFMLGYSEENFKKNPISSFVYFIPLISPTLVDRVTSDNNMQQVGVISYEKKDELNSLKVECEFKIEGKGFHQNTYDPEEMIARNVDGVKGGKPLKKLLDYIKVEGGGFGRIEVKIETTGPTYTVSEVNIFFNARGQKSPVTIGLYDVKPKDGQYKYENRYNEIIARVNKLMFRKSEEGSEEPPRMDIEVSHVYDKTATEGLWSWIKGKAANWFYIDPIEVDKLGNDTMLDFGNALYNEQPEYIFPKARNLKENRRGL